MPKTKSYKVYGMLDEDMKLVYIGQTTCTLKSRLGYHRRSMKKSNSKLYTWLSNYYAEGKKVSLHLIEDEATKDISEIIWIDRFFMAGVALLNSTRGGTDDHIKCAKFRCNAPLHSAILNAIKENQ